jgi:DNA helicase II / ATP-dependent DNA helicase PcrA
MNISYTEEQQAIIAHDPRRHARILAGPGTGKSTTLVRLVQRVREANPDHKLRMLTFTRAATSELAVKVAVDTGIATRPSTVHSFAMSILAQNHGASGILFPIRIADRWEEENVVNRSLARESKVNVWTVRSLIQEMAANWESLTPILSDDISEHERTRFRAVWNEHRRVLGYTFLAELPFQLLRALESNESLLGANYDVLFVDEYQDLNACDLRVLKLISEKSSCVVIAAGDDDQSIYSGRHANPKGIRRFVKDYENACDYALTETQRCGKSIIEWANHVIRFDPDRDHRKTPLAPTCNSPEGEVALLSFADGRSESQGVAQLVASLVRRGIPPREILILTRSDARAAFSGPIRTELEKRGVPSADPTVVYRITSENSNRYLLALLRVLSNRTDSLAWASLLKLTDGVGDKFFKWAYDQARNNGKPFGETLLSLHSKGFSDGPSNSSSKAEGMISMVLGIIDSTDIPESDPGDGWGSWVTNFARTRPTLTQPTPDLINLLWEVDHVASSGQTLGQYLNQVQPLGRDLYEAKSSGVRIMTMTRAKGLTVAATIVVGAEDGLIPCPLYSLSEECRILYVAMTRAKEYLYCTWAQRRTGPTARAGNPNLGARRYSDFLDGGPVRSQSGEAYVRRFTSDESKIT